MQVTEQQLIYVLNLFVNRATEQGNQQKADAAVAFVDYLKQPFVDKKVEYKLELDDVLLTFLREYGLQCRVAGNIEKENTTNRAIQNLLGVAE